MSEEHFPRPVSRDKRTWADDVSASFVPYLPVGSGAVSTACIVARLARAPVPVTLLVTVARRLDFPGLPLLEYVAAMPGESSGHGETSGGDLFASAVAAAKPTTEAERVSLEEAFGRVASLLGEERPGQLLMARAVARALRSDGLLLVEAGTGIGKSLAYLVPAAAMARETGERVVISTHTRNLQHQLLTKELPRTGDVLGYPAAAAWLMGRENYLCARRLLAATAGLVDDDPETALALGLSASLSIEGTVDSLPLAVSQRVRRRITAPLRCAMHACAHASHCPLVRSRRRARESSIVVVNHALLLTDYRQGGAILGPYRRVIFDEAHHVERCAMENLSVTASREGIDLLIDPIRPVPSGDDRWRLLHHELDSAEAGVDRVAAVADAMRMLSERYEELFRSIETGFDRAQVPRRGRTRFVDGAATVPAARDPIKNYLLYYNNLKDIVKPFTETSAHGDARAFQQELIYTLDELAALSDAVPFIMRADDEDSVFWMEWGRDGRLRMLCASPLSVDRLFADYIEEVCDSAVFTSATLAQNGDFTYQRNGLGFRHLSREADDMVVPSPFEFEKRCLMLLNTDLGDPNGEGYAAVLAGVVGSLVRAVRRRTMVLFTSYRLCRETARRLEGGSLPGPMFVQGDGMSREMLAGRLRASPAGVLLGVASFWEGIDFPGEELELLVIPKLPFPVPTEPIVEARSERLRALGEDPFEQLFLPEAILKMRQGIGRLIRRRDDRGVVVILDSRIGCRPYGPTIVAGLPAPVVHTAGVDELVGAAGRWFDGVR